MVVMEDQGKMERKKKEVPDVKIRRVQGEKSQQL